MRLRTWAATVPWNLSVPATKKKVQVPALRCRMHLRAENHHPRLPENLSVLRLVSVLLKWEFQVQVRLPDVLLSLLSMESPTERTRRGRTTLA
jgi:hypothetical protein